MEDYKPNSYKHKEEERKKDLASKKVQKVVTGNVKIKKKSEAKKFAEVFVSEDVSRVKDYIFMDVLVPAVKKAISDIVRNGIDMILYGESGVSKKGNDAASKVSYRSYYDSPSTRTSRRETLTRSTYNYDDVILESRSEAEAVIEQMDEIIMTYGFVKVADFYDLTGITGSFTDNNYGWTDIHTAQVIRVSDGYKIKLPRALPID